MAVRPLFWQYAYGLPIFMLLSLQGIRLILRAGRNETNVINGAITVPKWQLYASGLLLQVPVLFYVYVGYKAGFYSDGSEWHRFERG